MTFFFAFYEVFKPQKRYEQIGNFFFRRFVGAEEQLMLLWPFRFFFEAPKSADEKKEEIFREFLSLYYASDL